ncbi:MAG: hypothetical protein GF418_03105 [Chitinivibrionales bacterium]|nr:hypothetical protein [Chitinivibrionales bacterium]MBD3394591.1 hypothetical protein [Chitinivibrionales bacterium]
MNPSFLLQCLRRAGRPFVLASLVLCVPAHARLIVISELLRNPAGKSDQCPGDACHEYVEITNLGIDTLSLDGLCITSGRYSDTVVPLTDTIPAHASCLYAQSVLAPGKTALILDAQYDSIPMFTIPDGTVLLGVGRSSILQSLTSTRGVLLYRGTRDSIGDSLAAAVDSGTAAGDEVLELTAPAGIPEGFSLVPEQVLFPSSAWRAHPDTLDPGAFSAAANGWVLEYRLGSAARSAAAVPCTLAILKAGARIPDGTSWEIREKETGTAVRQGTITGADGPYIATADLARDSCGYELTVSGNGTRASADIDLSVVWIPAGALKINEIFPRAASREPEWIELHNHSTMPINLKNWRFGRPDASDTITAADYVIAASAFCVLTREKALFDSAYPVVAHVLEPPHWPALDNYHDTLMLWTPLDPVPSETVFYTSDWFESWEQQSLERVSLEEPADRSGNWVLADIPSPGQPNRSTSWRTSSRPGVHIGPIPFTPNGDGVDDLLLIRLTLPADASASTTVYGFDGSVVLELPGPAREEFLWDGRDKHGRDSRVGPFFVVTEIRRSGGTTRIRKKGILWR